MSILKRASRKARFVWHEVSSRLNVEGQSDALETRLGIMQPAAATIGVTFFAPPPNRFHKGGKLNATHYLPVFCDYLRERGVATFFASSERALARAMSMTERSVVVCIYREEGLTPRGASLISILDKADLVFNHPWTGAIISDKLRTNEVLSAAGCSVPRLATGLEERDVVFSNARSSTGAATFTAAKAEVDESRYNTEFIDTAREYRGRRYYAMLRLMCINERITHYSLRLRDVEENDASVHAKNTPLDAGLINSILDQILSEAGDQLADLARRIFWVLGPGFYAHDTLVDARTGRVYVCETGYKFNNGSYESHLAQIARKVVSMNGFDTPENTARASAPIFLDLVCEAMRERSPR